MTLRSGISRVAAAKLDDAPENPPADTPDEQEAAPPEPVVQQTPSRGRVTAPPAAEPPSKAPVGRPRMSDEQKQAKAEARVAAPKPPRTKPVAAPGSVKELRAALRELEAEGVELSDQIAVATAKFKPKLDALHARHAELSKQLSAALFR